VADGINGAVVTEYGVLSVYMYGVPECVPHRIDFVAHGQGVAARSSRRSRAGNPPPAGVGPTRTVICSGCTP